MSQPHSDLKSDILGTNATGNDFDRGPHTDNSNSSLSGTTITTGTDVPSLDTSCRYAVLVPPGDRRPLEITRDISSVRSVPLPRARRGAAH